MRAAYTDCGQPHCPRCRAARDNRQPTGRHVAGLVAFFSLSAVLLLLVTLAAVWPR